MVAARLSLIVEGHKPRNAAARERRLLQHLADVARAAVGGANLAELSDMASAALATEMAIQPTVARQLLVEAAHGTATVEKDLRTFLSTLANVLALAQRVETAGALIDQVPDAIIRFDRDLRCVYINSRGERLLGVTRERLLGVSIGGLGLPEIQRGACELALRLSLRTGHEQRLELGVGDRAFEARFVPQVDLENDVTAVVSIWREL
jgi:PAS domain S-box-containing protein